MDKFDNILNQYITELSIDPSTVGRSIGSKIGSADTQTKNALEVLSAIGQSADKDPIHQNLIKVINPETKEKFADIFKSESDKIQALERLKNMGIPIGNVEGEKPENNQSNTQQSKDNTETSSIEKSTSYGVERKIQGA